jgi:hypothetical protein
MFRLSARLIAVVTALSVLVPGGASARTQYFCRMMNRVVATCCCDQRSSVRDAGGPEVRSPECCEPLSTVVRSVPAAAPTTEVSIPPAAYVATASAPLPVPKRTYARVSAPPRARAPPSLRPPLFIANCSLLT